MRNYQEEKIKAREKAMDIQAWLSENSASWGELADIQSKLERLGRRYGLIREFRENGLI